MHALRATGAASTTPNKKNTGKGKQKQKQPVRAASQEAHYCIRQHQKNLFFQLPGTCVVGAARRKRV